MKRWLTGLILLVLAGMVAAWFIVPVLGRVETPIRVGILHSQTGPTAISEKSMVDAEVLALEEINAEGGLVGRRVEWVIADGHSDWPVFSQEARRLIDQEHVNVIFGCWTSASRKSVMPIVEQKSHLLIYPMAYEGLEESPNIIYTGAAPNQQVIPAVSWCYSALKARNFYLVGSDYVWPHCVNEIIKDELNALGAKCVGESYILFGSADVQPSIDAIRNATPDVIISTVVGQESNRSFYQAVHDLNFSPERTPIVSFSVAEDELRKLPLSVMVGDYAAWNYFQSIDRPENREFIRRFQARYPDNRVTSDVIEAAYNSVRLWAQAVAEAESAEVKDVLRAVGRQSLNAPEGIVTIDKDTQHTWRPVRVGQIQGDGQFKVVWSSDKPIRPIPFPPSRSRSDWESFLESLYRSWRNNWANPGPAVHVNQDDTTR